MSDQREESPCAASPGSEEGFRKLVDAGLVGMAVGRPDKGLVSFNQPFCDMLGYTLEELKEKRWDELTHPEDLAEDQQRFEAMLAGDTEGYTLEKRYVRKDGGPAYARISVTCLRRPDGSVRETFGIIQDISEQKRLELALRENQQRLQETLAAQATALEEKEALLREVNHRVKNNLQVLISMLRLQGQRDEREGVSEALGDVTQRVRAIALVHEILYGAPSLAKVELSAYVPELVRGLRASLSRPSRVMTSLDIAPGILLNPDEAVTCGMVLNELITNAIRHAFPHGNGGHIAIEGYPVGDGRIRVTVRDDGVGLGESVDWRRTDTLGLTLAVGLVENQLDGDITLEKGPGVALSFTFKALNPAISP